MKFLSLLVLIAALSPDPLTTPSQPQIEILKFSCRRLPQSKSPSDKKAQEKRNEMIDLSIAAEYQQDHPDLGRIRALENMKNQPVPDNGSKASNKMYEYKFRLRNTGSLQIVSLKWDYVFTDATTGNELVRHSFVSKLKVQPYKETDVILYAPSGPPMVVNATALKKDGRAWDEALVIEAIEYADGSRWTK